VPPVIARRKAGFPSEDLREMAWTKTYLTAWSRPKPTSSTRTCSRSSKV